MQAIYPIPCNSLYDGGIMAGGRPAKFERTAFGERLTKLRVERGMSQAQLAEAVGFSQQAYAGWERSTTALRPDDIVKLAKALSVSTDELLGCEAPKARASGPAGRLRRVFDSVSGISRHQQQKIADTLETLIAGQEARKTGS